MSAMIEQVTADAGAGAPALPMRKRKKEDGEDVGSEGTPEPDSKFVKAEDGTPMTALDDELANNAPMSKAREIRLEQNRKAARESRRRKKVMIEELQRSVIFFSRANGTLKQQNEELSRLLMQSQAQIASIEAGKSSEQGQSHGDQQQQQQQQQTQESTAPVDSAATTTQETTEPKEAGNEEDQDSQAFQQAQAQAVATQAVLESQVSYVERYKYYYFLDNIIFLFSNLHLTSCFVKFPTKPQGFPAAAARAAAQTMNAGATPGAAPGQAPAPATGVQSAMPNMQPGATMQAMSAFQQAAAQAMAAAMQGMQGMGMNMISLTAQPAGANPQQAYTDAMTAIAMQQAAAAAAAGQQVGFFPSFMPMMAWAPQQQQTAQPAPAQPQQQQQQQQQQQPTENASAPPNAST